MNPAVWRGPPRPVIVHGPTSSLAAKEESNTDGGEGAHRLLSRKDTIRQTAIKPIDKRPWRGARINWLNVLINLGTFVLLMTDVPRGGAITRLNMRRLSETTYSWFGSFAYEVITFHRDPMNISNLTASRYGAEVDHARVWSYTYDTTSLQLRTITSMFNSSDSHTLKCMNYEIHCQVAGALPIEETFSVLERIVDYVATLPDDTLPSVYPLSNHDYQSLRVSKQMKSRFVFILYDKLIAWFLSVVRMHWFRVSHWPDINLSLDVCANPRDRPFLCDAGGVADYSYTADPNDAESANVTFVWDSINDRVRAIYAEFQNATSNIMVDVTILEVYTEPITYVGGLVTTDSDEFEIVVLTRVRDCSTDYSDAQGCRTIRLVDYRFEGGSVVTDLDDWNHLVAFLRFFAQAYYIIRVFGLFLGCYFALPPANRSSNLAVFLAFSEVPWDIVVYGSFIPVAMYSIAAIIDGPAVSAIVHLEGLKLQGAFMTNPRDVYTLICALMRKQWHMAFVAMLWVRFQAAMGVFSRHRGIASVRGHVFGILACLSMIVGYYNPKFRDTRVLGHIQASTSNAVTYVRTQTRDSANRWYGGYYCDVFSIGLSVVVYVTVVSVLHSLRGMIAKLLGIKTPSKNGPREDFRQIVNTSLLFCWTDMLPSTFNTLWGADGLTCGWASDVFFSIAGLQNDLASVELTRRTLVMNIVQLTDPWNYLKLRCKLNVQEVYTYMQVGTQTTFMVINPLDHDPVFKHDVQSSEFLLVQVRPSYALRFHELVQCR